MKVLLATDGSEHSQRAVHMATTFGIPPSSEIKIVSVVERVLPLNLDIYSSGYMLETTKLEKVARENALRVLENARQRLLEELTTENVTVSTEVLEGSPESTIVETAEKMAADLIIVGSHGYNTWQRLLLGSVSDSVVHHAPCSVLVVRAQKE